MAVFDLVFEGGGAKGSVFAGALEVFYGAGHTHGRLVGTSAGAITAAFVAAGYKPEGMLAAVTEQLGGKPRFASFMDAPAAADFDQQTREESQLVAILKSVDVPGVPDIFQNKVREGLLHHLLAHSEAFRHIFSFIECGGYYSGSMFVEWLREKLAVQGIAGDCTLADMHAQKGCDLSLVATDTSNREMLVLNHRTAPLVPVAMAVRMSMSIPFVWREVIWKKEWGAYMGRDKTDAKIVDGGVLSNFPIDLVARADGRVKSIMGASADPTAALNLGMLIDEELAVEGVEGKPVRQNPLKTVRRMQRLVDTMTGARDSALIRDFAVDICRLPARAYGTTEFDMPQPKINALVEAGRAAMRAHLEGRGFLPAADTAGAGGRG